MKKIIYLALAFAMTACVSPKGEEQTVVGGSIEITPATRSEVTDTVEGRTTIAVPAAEDLAVEITGNNQTYTWATLADYVAEAARGIWFHSSAHTVKLTYGVLGEEGYGKPYFEGSTTVEVPGYKLSVEAQVEVALANSIVNIDTTAQFDGYFQQSTPKFVVKGIEWNEKSEDMLFVNPGKATITCDVVKPSGNAQTLTVEVTLNPSTRHTVVFDLDTAGSAEFVVLFDNQIVEIVESEFEMNDNA
jgi:hypothetical protein